MWDALKDLTFDIIQYFYHLFGDWGVAIIIVTVIVRLLLAPIMNKSTKSSFMMQKLQPKIQEIQKKYADNPQRLQEEMRNIYAESKFNPLSGCLPMFLQMPVFILLFQVLQEMGQRTQGSTYEFYHLVPNLVIKPSQAFGEGFLTFLPYLCLLLIFAGATFLPVILLQRTAEGPQKNQTLMMSGIMSLFMLWVGWGSPAGVLLYWGTSSLLGLAQQQITLAVLRKEYAAKEAANPEPKPVKVEVTRKEKKPRPTKSR